MKKILVAAVCIWAIGWFFFSWRVEHAIRANSTTTGFEIVRNGDIHTSLTAEERHYSLGDYGICEIANTRIAVRGYGHRGSTGHSSNVTLATDCDLVGGGGSSSGFGLNFSDWGILGGSHCVFGPISFDIIDGTLYLKNKEFDIITASQLIIIDRNGEIESTSEIPTFQIAPEWKPEEPRISPRSRSRSEQD